MNYEWINTKLMNELINYESIDMQLEYDEINELQIWKLRFLSTFPFSPPVFYFI